MRLAQIFDSTVVNVIEVDPEAIPDWAEGWPEAGAAGPGWLWDGANFTPPPEPVVELAPARAAAIAAVNAAIGIARSRWITDAPGQEMIYLAKEAEARAWLADPVPDPEDYPLLVAEIGVTAPTAWELAQLWLNMAALWRGVAAQLEALRLTTIGAIEAAEDAAAVAGIEDGFAAALELLVGELLPSAPEGA